MAELRQSLHRPIRRIPRDRVLLHGLLGEQRGPANGHREDRLDGTELDGRARRNASRRWIVHLLRRCDPGLDGCDEWDTILRIPSGWRRMALLCERLPGERERDPHHRASRDGRREQRRDLEELRRPDQWLIV